MGHVLDINLDVRYQIPLHNFRNVTRLACSFHVQVP